MHKYWYKEAVIYSMDIRSFKDSDGDGLGDLRGMIEHFNYFVELGVNCIWILPFYASEGKDFGYDIKGYMEVDPKLGTLDDFRELMELAKKHNIKILLDLVVNHTSIKHPWFMEARQNKDSPYYDYYIWAKERPKNHAEDVIFEQVEDSNWEYDEVAGEYYYHTFYHFQADLNIPNPQVQKEIREIIEFWMKFGIAGFRMDAVPHLVRKKGVEKDLDDSFEVLDSFKKIVTSYHPDGTLVGEADVEPEDYLDYFEGRRIDGIFNFYFNNFFFYALATNNPQPLIKAFRRLPDTHESECYLNFIRNHDELDLGRLSDEQRETVYKKYAPEEDMKIYGRGIRRRLPPMVGNDKRILEFCYSVLLSFPGTPVLRYGQEIGMGDDLSLKERNSVRTAMQWNSGKNGGFSDADATNDMWPVIRSGEYGYQQVNVEDQLKDKDSLLNTLKEMIRIRKGNPALSHGPFEVVETGSKVVMAHICRFEDDTVLAIHNFSEKEEELTIPEDALKNVALTPTISRRMKSINGTGERRITLGAYGFVWFSTDGNS